MSEELEAADTELILPCYFSSEQILSASVFRFYPNFLPVFGADFVGWACDLDLIFPLVCPESSKAR